MATQNSYQDLFWDAPDDYDAFSDSDLEEDKTFSSCDSDTESEPELDSHCTADNTPADKITAAKVQQILETMSQVGMDLPTFLDALSWGNPACISNPTIKGARSSLMSSRLLRGILERWWRPPRQGSRKNRPKAASAVLLDLMHAEWERVVQNELKKIAALFETPPAGEDLTEAALTSLNMDSMAREIKNKAPILWKTLWSCAYSTRQEKVNKKKTSEKVLVLIVSLLLYCRSHHWNRLQKVFAIYLKFHGLTAKAFDALHALGITMSYKWTTESVINMSKAAMEEVVFLMLTFAWLISYDNINIAFRVFSQRLDQNTKFGSGTAATVYIKKDTQPLGPEDNRELQRMRKSGMENPLTEAEILELAQTAEEKLHPHIVYKVLRILFDAPDFDFNTWSGRKSGVVSRPPPIHQLPSGPDHHARQFLLGTVNIAEASYEDNLRLINEWLKQLGFGEDVDDKTRLALEQLIVWCGDQLTIDRLRYLFRFRSEDSNSYERLDWAIHVFGWLHLLMADANSIHKQYFGTTRGTGLRKAFALLEKKGLLKQQTKGPFYHDLDEAIQTIAEAHLRLDWLLVGKVSNLKDLRSRSPEEILDLAEKIVDTHASYNAINSYDEDEWDDAEHFDEYQRQTIMWNRDVLYYLVLDEAVSSGDVGIMEHSLPQLLFRFAGGNNSKYQIEVLELLQGLNREWPENVKQFVREHCWLVNLTGHFSPIDAAQEHNIKDIKVTYRSQGPNIQWEYLKKLHPAVPIIRSLSQHLEQEFGTISRGQKHKIPSKEKDLRTLQDAFSSGVDGHSTHEFVAGRSYGEKSKDKADDYAARGVKEIGTVIEKWVKSRHFPRSGEQDWHYHTPGPAGDNVDAEEDDNEESEWT